MESKVKVLVVMTEPLLADGIGNAVTATDDLELVGKPGDRAGTSKLICEMESCVAIIDCDLLEPDCLRAIEKIKQEKPNLAILALVSKTTPSRLLQYLQAGIAGYLRKTATADEVVDAIRRVCAGEAVLPLSSMRELIQHLEPATGERGHSRKGQPLTHKELEVLKLASKGLSNKEIAERLYISERTVQSYLTTIFGKLGVASRTEAVSVAWKNGWITSEDLVD